MTCFVKDCKNVRRLLTPKSKISFHRFPSDEKTFRVWLHALGKQNENVSWSRTKFICSDHFEFEDFEIVAHKRHLRPCAIPVLHLHREGKYHEDNIVSVGTMVGTSTSLLCTTTENHSESSESDSSTDGKRKRIQLDHSYARCPSAKRIKKIKACHDHDYSMLPKLVRPYRK